MDWSSVLNSLAETATQLNTSPSVFLLQENNIIQFPVPPKSFDVNVANNNTTININSIGELNLLGKTGLKQVSFESFFPAQHYKFCSCTPLRPYSYVDKLEIWRTNGKPCKFIISGTNVNFPVSINKFTWGEHDGTNDLYFVLELAEYRYTNGSKALINQISGLLERGSQSQTLTQDTIVAGDEIANTVHKLIGKKYNFGNGSEACLSLYKKLAKSGITTAGTKITYNANTGNAKIGD